MSEEDKKIEPPVERAPVKAVEPKKCDHEGKLEAVSAREAEIDVPPVAERSLDFFRCKDCGTVIVKDKK